MALSTYDQLKRDHDNGVIMTTSGPNAGLSAQEIQQKYADETAARATPADAQFMGAVDSGGNLLDKYKLADSEKLKHYDEVKADSRGLDAIRERALNRGPSDWEQMMNTRQGMDQQNQLDKGARVASTQAAQGINSMMARGGAGGGSMERMAAGAAKDAMFNRNAVNRQGMSDRLGIGLAGQQEKSDLLKTLPGFDNQVAGLKMQNNQFENSQNQFNIQNQNDQNRFNITNALKGAEMQNTQNQNQYNQKMQAMAANKQADATERSAGK